MHRFLTLPILVPMLLGLVLLVAQPKDRRVRSIYVTASALVTSVLSFLCILITYAKGSAALACILVRFSESFSISLHGVRGHRVLPVAAGDGVRIGLHVP